MKRRLISMFLVLVLIFTVLPCAASAEGYGLATSEECIELIKKMEGYLDKPKWDVAQNSIGYGCSTEYAKKYGFSTEYLSKSDADTLMRLVIIEMENKLDKFLLKYEIDLNQHQYDALVSFTYNVGSMWMKTDSRLGELLIAGDYTDNEFASALGVYCHVGSGEDAEVDANLVDRRIREIKMFLYGAYELDAVDNKFCTLTFVGNGGDRYTDIAFYEVGQPYGTLFGCEPTDETDTYFIGWYTEDGEKVTASTIAEGSDTVYAHWSEEEEDPELDIPEVVYIEASELFSDVYADQWYYGYVNDLVNEGVINGYVDHTFRPNNTVNTGEALKMILLAAGFEEPEMVTDHWASGYHYLALDYGIIDRGDIIDLDVPITRVMVAKIAANSLGLSRLYDDSPFSDTDNLYAVILHDYEIVTGYVDGTFGPGRSLTRSELSAIVWRMNHLYE